MPGRAKGSKRPDADLWKVDRCMASGVGELERQWVHEVARERQWPSKERKFSFLKN
jgi:hypothetical protein